MGVWGRERGEQERGEGSGREERGSETVKAASFSSRLAFHSQSLPRLPGCACGKTGNVVGLAAFLPLRYAAFLGFFRTLTTCRPAPFHRSNSSLHLSKEAEKRMPLFSSHRPIPSTPTPSTRIDTLHVELNRTPIPLPTHQASNMVQNNHQKLLWISLAINGYLVYALIQNWSWDGKQRATRPSSELPQLFPHFHRPLSSALSLTESPAPLVLHSQHSRDQKQLGELCVGEEKCERRRENCSRRRRAGGGGGRGGGEELDWSVGEAG